MKGIDSPPLSTCKYWAFVSYSHKDSHWGRWVHSSLEKYRVPRRLVGQETAIGPVPRRIFPVFRDREELSAASDLSEQIRLTLQQSRFLIVICSVTAAKSRWVNEEVKLFKQIAGDSRVLSVIVDGQPNSWDGSEECFPPAIRFEVAPTGQLTKTPSEPIAADARPSGDGKYNAKLKLISSLLGVPYDDLRRRESERRRRNILAWLCSVAMIVVAVIAILAHQRARSLVDSLETANIGDVPRIVEQIDHYRPLANPLLISRFQKAEFGTRERLHLALSLLSVDESKIRDLRDHLLVATPSEHSVIREALVPYKDSVVQGLWDVASDRRQDPKRRFRAACALATYTPADDRWKRLSLFVARHLVNVMPSELTPSQEALLPVNHRLVPSLEAIYRDEEQGELARSFATDTLAFYSSSDANTLFDLLADARHFQFEPLFVKLREHREQAISLAEAEIEKATDDLNEGEKEALSKRKANAAVMLLRLGHSDAVWPLLRHSPDPRVRSYIIHWFNRRGGDPDVIITRFDKEEDVTIKTALLLCLGEFSELQMPIDRRVLFAKKRLSACLDDRNAGMRAAAEWLLKEWKQVANLARLDRNPAPHVEQQVSAANPRWYSNDHGHTMVVLRADKVRMGSPDTEVGRRVRAESLRSVTVARTFAVSSKEITVDDIRKWWPGYGRNEAIMSKSPTGDSPAVALSWIDAVAYCNWLSKSEGISDDQLCYRLNEQGNYVATKGYLKLNGYRLPTEAEWEYACRANTVTSRYFGQSEELLSEYGHMAARIEQSLPVGSLKPNDFGLFDTLGNAWEWCDDLVDDNEWEKLTDDGYPGVVENKERFTRGGSYGEPPERLRAAYRTKPRFALEINADIGFRIAKTITQLIQEPSSE